MYFFRWFGFYVIQFSQSLLAFFSFLGHLSHSSVKAITRNLKLTWSNVSGILYYSGARVSFPLMLITALFTVSISLNAISIFSRFNLQQRALSISQTILIQDLLPLILGFVLCIQVSLDIINARIKITKHKQTPQEVALEYILPLMVGISLTGLLLCAYLLMTTYIALYFTFHEALKISLHSFLFQAANMAVLQEIVYSIVKTLIYCFIISLTAGYYYYQVAITHIPLRKAVSRILTRGLLWLALISVYLKLSNY